MSVLNLLNTETDLKAIQCGTCGVWHAIPQAMFDACLENGGYWYCPNGHQRGYGEGTAKHKLEKEIKRRKWAEQNAENTRKKANRSERRRIAQKAATTKLKNRIMKQKLD